MSEGAGKIEYHQGFYAAMRCPSCNDSELLDSSTAYFVALRECYIIIENVPCRKCPQCGEEYFSASVMERIDEILARVKNIASKIFIMDYQAAA